MVLSGRNAVMKIEKNVYVCNFVFVYFVVCKLRKRKLN